MRIWLATLFFALNSTVNIQQATSAAPSPFVPALPGYEFQFPRDHGTHNEYRTEWWYYTGHLRTDSGRRYGFELTFFRVGVEWRTDTPVCPEGKDRQEDRQECLSSTWDLHNLAPAHFAITDIDGRDFRYYEKLNRVSPFTAGAAEGRLDVFNESWHATTLADGSWRIVAQSGKDAIDLVLRSRKPPAINGENGVSAKAIGEGNATHYYSMTRLEANGTIDNQHCRGLVWMDHEFGSSLLSENQQGWDWFSIVLDNDSELMLYQMRRKDGTPDVTSSGSLIASDGSVIHIRANQMQIKPLAQWRSPKTKGVYPMGWRVIVPSFGIDVTLKPLLRDQELVTSGSTRVTYWEGAVDVNGTFNGNAVGGEGYVEMTGYAKVISSQ
jgi:predicted secreted hydrolase